MSFEKFKPAYLHPKYWLSWLIVGFTWLLAQIPRPWQSGISGWVARRLANSRNSRIRTIRRNIDLCFIEKSEAEREKLVVANLSSSVLGMQPWPWAYPRRSIVQSRFHYWHNAECCVCHYRSLLRLACRITGLAGRCRT
ncbi:MAG: hypothetical protein ACPG4B_09845 [Cycloclasticus sp.]|uniref:LpxL/LpxP family acyltransferase n=1 Tax=Cycloclasticus pugetii TaxID=34068 RepID=UPI003A8D04BB